MIKIAIRNLFVVSVAVIAFSACDMFYKDNYEAPNATLRGKILDEVTGDLVETDIQNGNALRLDQYGWNPGGVLTRVVKQNGEYQDKQFFAGKYRLEFSSCNFYPHIIDTIVVNKGDNVMDFKVMPYIRVKNVKIIREGNEIVATFNLEASKSEVRLNNVRLYFHTDMYVGDQVTRYALQGSGFQQTFSPTKVIDPNEQYKLTIDLTNATNKSYFKYVRNYYFRVGAMAAIAQGGTAVGTIRRNYAPYQIINFNTP